MACWRRLLRLGAGVSGGVLRRSKTGLLTCWARVDLIGEGILTPRVRQGVDCGAVRVFSRSGSAGDGYLSARSPPSPGTWNVSATGLTPPPISAACWHHVMLRGSFQVRRTFHVH